MCGLYSVGASGEIQTVVRQFRSLQGICVMYLRDLEKKSQSVDERVVLDCVSNLKETP